MSTNETQARSSNESESKFRRWLYPTSFHVSQICGEAAAINSRPECSFDGVPPVHPSTNIFLSTGCDSKVERPYTSTASKDERSISSCSGASLQTLSLFCGYSNFESAFLDHISLTAGCIELFSITSATSLSNFSCS